MDYQTFVQQLQKEACQPIYFFYGEEVLLRQRALKILEKQILPEGLEDFNKDILLGNEASPKQIAEMAMNLPFMANYRLLIVQSPLSFLSIPKSDKAGQEAIRYLLDYMETPNPQCCLVFLSEDALGKTGVLNKKLQEKAVQVEFAPLKGKVLEKWIVDYVTAAGQKIDLAAVGYLSSMNRFDLQIMEQELQKLLSYCKETPVIYLGETPFKLIGFLARHFRNLVLIKDYQRMGYNETQIKEKTKLHPFVIKKSLRQAEQFSMQQLVKALERLLRVETELKSTTANGEELLEQFIIELCYL